MNRLTTIAILLGGLALFAPGAAAQTLLPGLTSKDAPTIDTDSLKLAIERTSSGKPKEQLTPAAWKLALRRALENTAAFERALALAADYPAAFHSLVEAKDTLGLAASLGLTSTNHEQLAKVLSGVSDSAQRESILVVSPDLRKLTNQSLARLSGTATASVFASGDLKAVATGDKKDATTATGSLGLRLERSDQSAWSVMIGVASSADTLRSNVAPGILTPSASARLLSGVIDFRNRVRGGESVHAYLSFARSTWGLEDQPTMAVDASVLGAGALYSRQVFRGKLVDTGMQLRLEAGASYRYVGGDIATHDSLRTALLGSRRHSFLGLEFGPEIQFGAISGALRAYFFPGSHVDGVTGLQLVGGFAIFGPFVSGAIDRP